MVFSLLLLINVCLLLSGEIVALEEFLNPPKEDAAYWRQLGIKEIESSLEENVEIKCKTKNVILFLGDGMGVSTVTAARIYKAQRQQPREAFGEETYLTFERFPHLALVKTYNIDTTTPDSAATATAYLSGVKGNLGTIGVDNNVLRGNCSSYNSNYDVSSILMDALNEGKSVGIVTTTRVTHASPAGAYASVADRNWESDTDRNQRVKDPLLRKRCPDIAQQLIEKASEFKVVLGGGRSKFLPKTWADPINSKQNGSRSDGQNLLHKWLNIHRRKKHCASLVYTRNELLNTDFDKIDYLMGLFSPSTLLYDEENKLKKEDKRQPSISEMTEAAIKVLRKNPKGFFLFVEGARIDYAHHENKARYALSETVAFDAAIAKAMEMTSAIDTLTMVTADHSHLFTFGGYSPRGKDVLIGSGPHNLPFGDIAKDKLPYLSINYISGPGGKNKMPRANLTGVDTTTLDFKFPAFIPLPTATHGGEDVAVYAKGPWAHLFHRVHEQTHVAMVARYAACLPPFTNEAHC